MHRLAISSGIIVGTVVALAILSVFTGAAVLWPIMLVAGICAAVLLWWRQE